MVVTTVGDGAAVGFVEVGGVVVVVRDSVVVDEESAEADDVVEAVLSATMVDESDVVGGSDSELVGLGSLVGRLGEVNVGSDSVLSALDGSDKDVAAEPVGSIVELDADPSSGS